MPFSRFALVLFVVGVARSFADAQQPQPSPTPGPIREEVIVTASRTETRLGETPASVATLGPVQIASSAAPVLDDVLRQTVGFSIFRRSSSRNANPTTQGVSLRGVGSSGASRSIVLFDGVPLNDPFGGWIQWNRVSPIEVDRVEVMRGGASSLYGDAGLSGAVNLIPRKREGRTLSAEVFGGTQHTLSGSVDAGLSRGAWSSAITASSFQTRGYIPIESAARGPVDSPAGVRTSSLSARLARDLGQHASIFIRPSFFGEVRSNGTGLQTNRTHIRQFVVGGDLDRKISLQWRAFGGTQVYDQVFSAIDATRTGESLTRVQRVPVRNIGVSVQASGSVKRHMLVGGIETRNVRGSSDEIGYANNVPTTLIGAGGRQTTAGAFVQDRIAIGSRFVLAGSLRFDHWSNHDATSITRPISPGSGGVTAFQDRSEDAFSPQGSMLYHASSEWSVYASVSRSFRAPTLNELYRSFRVGNVLTLANENLAAERANNFEGGVSFARRQTFIRGTGFWTQIDQPVANVTLPSITIIIVRQRQNMGETRSRGFEIEGERRFDRLTLSGGYLFVDSVVTSFPANVVLVGRRIPQVARHQFTLQSRYSHGDWTIALQARGSSDQFDDDLNQFRLEPYAQFDVFGAKDVGDKLQIFASAENVFNSRYSIGRTPMRTVSSPTGFRIGFRFRR